MKLFRSLLALFSSAAILFSLVGCGYSAVSSTEEELAIVLTLDGGNYNGDKISFYTRINTRNNVIEADKSVIRRRLLFELNLSFANELNIHGL